MGKTNKEKKSGEKRTLGEEGITPKSLKDLSGRALLDQFQDPPQKKSLADNQSEADDSQSSQGVGEAVVGLSAEESPRILKKQRNSYLGGSRRQEQPTFSENTTHSFSPGRGGSHYAGGQDGIITVATKSFNEIKKLCTDTIDYMSSYVSQQSLLN